MKHFDIMLSRDSSVGIAGCCELDGGGSIPGRGKIFFSYPQCPDWQWGPLNLVSNGLRWLFFNGIERQGIEADHSPPSSAELKNGGAIPPLPHTSPWRNA
jgi:hypothetical protein